MKKYLRCKACGVPLMHKLKRVAKGEKAWVAQCPECRWYSTWQQDEADQAYGKAKHRGYIYGRA